MNLQCNNLCLIKLLYSSRHQNAEETMRFDSQSFVLFLLLTSWSNIIIIIIYDEHHSPSQIFFSYFENLHNDAV